MLLPVLLLGCSSVSEEPAVIRVSPKVFRSVLQTEGALVTEVLASSPSATDREAAESMRAALYELEQTALQIIERREENGFSREEAEGLIFTRSELAELLRNGAAAVLLDRLRNQ